MNLIMIAADTLRADHLSCYGYPKPTTPNIDALAERGVRFAHCFSQGNCTHPGFTTIFTGRYPINHEVVCHWTPLDLSDEIPTLAQILQRNGYTTAAVDDLYNKWEKTHRLYPWFKRGYQSYKSPLREHKSGMGQGGRITDLALEWLKNNDVEPFFLFIHYWDAHAPYAPPERNRTFYDGEDPRDPANKSLDFVKKSRYASAHGDDITDIAYIVSLYDAEVNFVDEQVGRIVEQVDALDIAEDTLFVFLADHGEILDEQRRVLGGIWCFSHIDLYDENIHVPLILAGGDALPAGSTVEAMVQHVDVAPTLLNVLGIEGNSGMDGQSLLPLTRGAVSDIGTVVHLSENTYQKKRGIRTQEWKLLHNLDNLLGSPRMELYNMTYDPDEQINLIDKERDLGMALLEQMNAWVREQLKGRADPLLEQAVRKRAFPGDFYETQ